MRQALRLSRAPAGKGPGEGAIRRFFVPLHGYPLNGNHVGGNDMSEVLAEFSIMPVVQGEWKPFMDLAVEELRRNGLKFEVGAESTAVEGDLDLVLDAIKSAHQAVMAAGLDRVITEIRIDAKKGGLSIDEEVADYR